MSAVQDRLEQQRLEELEAAAWRVPGATAANVDAILAAAEAYAQAVAAAPRPLPAIRLPEDAPVHFQSSPGRSACRRRERPIAGRLTRTPGLVTCGNCHRSPEWRTARAEALAPSEPWALALDEFLGATS